MSAGQDGRGTGEAADPALPDGPSGASVIDALQAAGEVGRDLLAVDWEATPLGPPQSWSNSLQTMVRVVISSRFAMWMAWGPELTFFCNEAYRRDTLGTKYPWALGRPAREVWAEIWPDIGPRIETVLRTGVATWDESLLLFLERSGYQEETYHTFSYSPLADDAGVTVGMLCVVSEDTERVIGDRRMATLRDLGAESTTGRDDRAYLRAAATALEANDRSLPFTLVYLFDEEGRTAQLAGSTGMPTGHAAAPATISPGPDAVWPLDTVERGEPAVVHGIDQRFADLPQGAWSAPPQTAVVLPLYQPVAQVRPYGFLVAGVNRYRPLDDSYRSFLTLVAAQLASGIAGTRAYEAERRRAEELAELDRAKTAFFTNVSHELRTPLTLLLGPAEDALGDAEHQLPDHERRRMEIIARNATRLLKLVNTLLDFSRLESGRAEAAFEPVELGQYTAELASMFESAVQRAGLEFVIDCPPLSEPVYVDREMWAKIVLNLLSNALKFTLSGAITIRLEQEAEMARLTVADTGIGIPAGEQARLFERFHRVAGARGRTHEGSGIGLALVAELAELHGARPSVHSAYGQGSTFTVEIPLGNAHLPAGALVQDPSEVSIERQVAGFLAEAERWLGPGGEGVTEPAAAEPAAGGGGRGGGASGEPRPSVLVVDDNQDMREYVSSLLADQYAVRTAPDGEAALELARADPPDLVLTDVMMPRLGGFGLLAALQADPRTLHVPVVMLSARAGEEGVIEGLEAGADDYLIKPFSARELLARVHANLELDRARRTRDELQRSRLMQDQAERLAEVGSWEVDLLTGAVRASDQWRRIFGMSRRELAELRFGAAGLKIVDAEYRDSVRQAMDDAVRARTAFEYERAVPPREGHEEERFIRVRGEVVVDDAGEPVALRGFVQDITQRRRAEEAIAASAAAREAAEREHLIADALQRSLLPPIGFDSDHLDVASFYQAGVAGTHVGGDWYEAIELGGGRTALLIGDVAGRGIRAASVMGQLRAAVRAYAQLDLPPAEVIELLDAMLFALNPGQLATCIYGVYDPAEQEFRWANAGHLPPLLVTPGGPARRLEGTTSPPLGVGTVRSDERRVQMPAGSLLALYTDGLVERRDREIDVGIDRLLGALPSDGTPVAELPDRLVAALAPEGTEDDLAILVARVSTEPGIETAVLDLPAEPGRVPDGRHFTVSTLRGWGLAEELVSDAALIVTELLTNAIVHGRPPVRLHLRRSPREVTIEVDDAAGAMPRKLRSNPEDLRGRGLDIVSQLATRWAARPDGNGKTVWCTLRVEVEAEDTAAAGPAPSS